MIDELFTFVFCNLFFLLLRHISFFYIFPNLQNLPTLLKTDLIYIFYKSYEKGQKASKRPCLEAGVYKARKFIHLGVECHHCSSVLLLS